MFTSPFFHLNILVIMKRYSSDSTALLNLQYGVTFAVIFSSFFHYDDQSRAVVLAIPWQNFVLIYLPMILYYFLDWFTANISRNIKTYYVLIYSFAIWALGFVIIYLNSQGKMRFILLSIYFIGTGLFDIVGGKLRCLATFKLILGIFLLAIVCRDWLYKVDEIFNIFVIILFVLIVKGLRLWKISTEESSELHV